MGYVKANQPTGGVARKRRQLSDSRHSKPKPVVTKRTLGCPSKAHLKLYDLDERSHPIEWFNSFMPLARADNEYNATLPNVKGDKKTKFAMSN